MNKIAKIHYQAHESSDRRSGNLILQFVAHNLPIFGAQCLL